MTADRSKNLQEALASVFSEEDAEILARLLESFQPDGAAYYQDIALPEFDTAAAIRGVLAEMGGDLAERLLLFFNEMKPHAVAYQVEGGLLGVLNEAAAEPLDLHAALDTYVMMGMMSPCPARSLKTRLPWFEISPVLYW